MIRLRQSGVDEILIKRVRDWYDPGPGVFIQSLTTALFSPAMLFTGSTNGVWYDPSDFSTMFQDAAGTTPVTAVEQPVGRILDKSGRGNHAFNSSGNSANFPVLSARYNLYTNTETLATQNVTTVATSYKLTFTGSGSITLTGTAIGVYTAGSYTISCTAGTLTSTVLGTVTQADLRATNDALNQPAYQRVNTSTDYDTAGFKPYLKFNGANQWLQTNSIDFSYGDKMFVCAGVRKLSDSAYPVIVENYDRSTYANFGLHAAAGAPPTGYLAGVTQSSSGNLSGYSPSNNAPVTNVVTASYWSKATVYTDAVVIRVNGASQALTTNSAGTPVTTNNFTNAPLSLFFRANNGAGPALWFNGRLYGMVVAGKQASAAEITSTETYINQKTGAY